MGHHHHHHGHSHHDLSTMDERKLIMAIVANFMLTFVQVVSGIVSGSLSLIADALHNFSDAASLVIALVAVRIGRRPADKFKTFGYKRAETIAALINLTTLILVAFYLCFEAVMRLIEPQVITGWIVIAAASFALIVDLYTAAITYARSKDSLNMRAAFLHNLSDAMASVGVILSGVLIIAFKWYWVDTLITLLIAGYILHHCRHDMPRVIHILMQGAPEGVEIESVIKEISAQDGVKDVHHVHIWRLDEHRNALEAHVKIEDSEKIDEIKVQIKTMLNEKFSISHSTLEFELHICDHR